jgi:hypothetical protein
MAGLLEAIGLLYRADWTRLSLSAEVRFEQDGDLARRREVAVRQESMRRLGFRPGPHGSPVTEQEPEDERGGYHRWRAALLIAPKTIAAEGAAAPRDSASVMSRAPTYPEVTTSKKPGAIQSGCGRRCPARRRMRPEDHPSRWRPFSSRAATKAAIASATAPGARRGR